MTKVNFPAPLSVRATVLPSLSVTVREASSYPWSGVTAMVTVVPLAALWLERVTEPWSAASTVVP